MLAESHREAEVFADIDRRQTGHAHGRGGLKQGIDPRDGSDPARHRERQQQRARQNHTGEAQDENPFRGKTAAQRQPEMDAVHVVRTLGPGDGGRVHGRPVARVVIRS